jgi:hypothetical protein
MRNNQSPDKGFFWMMNLESGDRNENQAVLCRKGPTPLFPLELLHLRRTIWRWSLIIPFDITKTDQPVLCRI